MTQPIDKFSGKYRFLSNFFPCEITRDQNVYPTVEHAFQAAKTADLPTKRAICNATTPGGAKLMGRRVELIENWDLERRHIMRDLLRSKFTQDRFKRLLLKTGDALLIEGNNWNDTYWGVCGGRGYNHLGRIIQSIREQIRRREEMGF